MDSQEIKVQPDQQKWSKIKNFAIFEISSSKSFRKSTIKYKYLKSGKLATPVLTTSPSEYETFKLPMMAVWSMLLHPKHHGERLKSLRVVPPSLFLRLKNIMRSTVREGEL